MRIIGIIPARYGSTRFPGKPLARVGGQPMIARVVARVRECRALESVIVATDDERIARVAEAAGAEAVLTDGEFASGTDRVAFVARGRDADVVVNVQGDEPLLPPDAIAALVAPFARPGGASMATLAAPFTDLAEVDNPRTAKVVADARGKALYFSRAPVPFCYRPGDAGADGHAPLAGYLRHIGIYAYEPSVLQRLASSAPTPLERLEGLEQLRALESGIPIDVVTVARGTIGVDTPEDLARVEELLRGGGQAPALHGAGVGC